LSHSRGRAAVFQFDNYLCTEFPPVRIPLRLYSDLVAGKITVAEFAGTIQHIAEALITVAPAEDRRLTIRATAAHFNKEGLMDLSSAAEAVALAIEGTKPKRVGRNILDIAKTLQFRKLKSETAWRIRPAMAKAMRDDIEGSLKLPTLRLKSR
jgi:hypothetical protein